MPRTLLSYRGRMPFESIDKVSLTSIHGRSTRDEQGPSHVFWLTAALSGIPSPGYQDVTTRGCLVSVLRARPIGAHKLLRCHETLSGMFAALRMNVVCKIIHRNIAETRT